MKLFDCTLRDGANVVGNGFSGELTLSIVRNLIGCGITDIELGNAKGLGAYEKLNSAAPLTDLEYMKLVSPYTGSGNLGMFQLAKLADERNIRAAAEHGLHFLRVGNNAGDGKQSVSAVKQVKAAGLYCRYSQMKAYICTPEELAEEARMLECEGVDAITIMDSAGTMMPADAAAYVEALKEKVSVPVGFHGHSNLGLSQANAMAAANAGADEIDCGLLGMARSAGNCSTELAAAVFVRENRLDGVKLYELLEYLDGELIPEMKKLDYRPAVMPIDLILGLSGAHSSFLPLFKRAAQENNVSLYKLIVDVSSKDRKAPSEELIRKTAQQ
ncbi:MAG: 4-hydroxy-2-oxovalerate aldolase [Oscillospiraceae bacterium]|nr:4-hydroxy-2-oxovalerate aldolase [Oscillospiraceae bacterium]